MKSFIKQMRRVRILNLKGTTNINKSSFSMKCVRMLLGEIKYKTKEKRRRSQQKTDTGMPFSKHKGTLCDDNKYNRILIKSCITFE